jgi:hypothetical protein
MLRSRPFVTGSLILFAVLVAAQSTLAGPLKITPFRYDDGTNAPWQGDRNLVGGPLFGATIDVTVDYAVFAPTSAGQGTFQQFLDATYGAAVHSDPTAGVEFIYAYQFAQVTSATDTIGNPSGVFAFTINIDPTDVVGPTAPGGHIDPVAPSFIPVVALGVENPISNSTTPAFPGEGPLNGDSAKWDFGGLLQVGETSTVIFFSSTREPEFDNGEAKVGVVSGQDQFPSPVPEPGSVVLLAFGLATLAGWRRFRRR